MIWFKHDSDASTDAKIKRLLIKYGAEGYAIYFHCLELIAGDVTETNITFELEHDAEIIADNLKIKGTAETSGIDKVNEIMKYIVRLGLFQESKGRIFCFKLLKRIDTSMTSNPRFRALITEAKKHHDSVMTESCKTISEEIISEETIPDTNTYTKTYNKSTSKSKKFIKPTIKEIEEHAKKIGFIGLDAEHFFYYYESNGWVQSKGKPITDWKASVSLWKTNDKKYKQLDKIKKASNNRVCPICGTYTDENNKCPRCDDV